jgi:probable HAF family extracellular repeat protein
VHAFLFEGGVMTDLGAPDGVPSQAVDINNRGQIAGWRGPAGARHAVVWWRGEMTDLGTLPGGSTSTAVAINNRGDVTGDADEASGRPTSFAWIDGVMTSLGTLTVGPGAVDINARAQIVGSNSESGRPKGFLWQDGVIFAFQPFRPQRRFLMSYSRKSVPVFL